MTTVLDGIPDFLRLTAGERKAAWAGVPVTTMQEPAP